MRLFSALSLCLFPLIGSAHAEGVPQNCLNEFASVIAPDAPLLADFEMQKRLPGFTHPLRAKGRVFSDPARGLIWETVFPLQEVRVFGKTRYASTNEAGELTVREHKAAGQIGELFTQSRENLLKTLNRSFFVSCKMSGNQYSVTLAPKNGTLANLLTEVALAAQNGKITRTAITQSDGTITRIEFSNAKMPATDDDRTNRLLDSVR